MERWRREVMIALVLLVKAEAIVRPFSRCPPEAMVTAVPTKLDDPGSIQTESIVPRVRSAWTARLPNITLAKEQVPYFWGCAAAGALSTMTSHSLFFPLDVLKTKMQSDIALAGMSAHRACRTILKTNGPAHFMSGFSANAIGYFSQGAIKFGLYETGKKFFSQLLESKNPQIDTTETRYRVPIWIVSSACAEVVACFALCPMEATKIRLVTDRSYAIGTLSAMRRLIKEEGLRALYRGSAPILIRQVPYTVAKLAGYEAISMIIGGGLLAGVIAGAGAAVISQPADVILSKLCGGSAVARLETCYLSVSAVYESLSFQQLFAGLTPRAAMCAAICAGQFFLYEALRPTSQPRPFFSPENIKNSD